MSETTTPVRETDASKEASVQQPQAVDGSSDDQVSHAPDVILASGSPRRRELLEKAGVKFRICEPDVDESLDDDLRSNPQEAVKKLAERKSGAVVQELLATEGYRKGVTAVMGADTMVVLDGTIYGKPHSISEATGMLRALSGNVHTVMTAVSVWMMLAPASGEVSLAYRTFLDTADVTFKTLADEDIASYVRCGESYDKAGAYAIQGKGAQLVESYDGSLDTIIGLPVTHLLQMFPELRMSDTV
jgi:septum formation protein